MVHFVACWLMQQRHSDYPFSGFRSEISSFYRKIQRLQAIVFFHLRHQNAAENTVQQTGHYILPTRCDSPLFIQLYIMLVGELEFYCFSDTEMNTLKTPCFWPVSYVRLFQISFFSGGWLACLIIILCLVVCICNTSNIKIATRLSDTTRKIKD